MNAPPPFEALPTRHFGAILAENEIELGKAAEHLVCADLLLGGYRAYLSAQGLPYDVVVDYGGKLIRVQVKSTQHPKNQNAKGRSPNFVYVFHVRRRGKNGNGSRLSSEHCDIAALVALDIRAIAYLPITGLAQTISLFPPGYKFPGKFKRNRYAAIDGFPFDRALLSC